MQKELQFERISEDIKLARSTKELARCNLNIIKFMRDHSTSGEAFCPEASILAEAVSNKVKELQDAGVLTMNSIGGIK